MGEHMAGSFSSDRTDPPYRSSSIPAFVGWFWAYAVVTGIAAATFADLVARSTDSVLPFGPTRIVVSVALIIAAGASSERAVLALARRSAGRHHRRSNSG
jgi:hypothetical protein